ncbi:MAG: DNA polymerase III subunit gamma/tau [Nitrospirota bacterium]
MSYLVLARKWRPQRFDDLIGQESITRILANSISQKKIAHAYIFSGLRGVGKTSTARILAKALNCENGPTPTPCDTCESCIAIRDGSSVDVLEIDGASNTGVDNIRDLREGVKYTALGGRYKIYIIDEAHMLSTPAFNALLKTIEEPPPHVIFVLATTAPKKIPATVLSRCQHLPFRRISSQKIKERLKMISDAEGINISSSAAEMIARAVDGSMRDALTILDQVSSFSSDIKEIDIKNLLGITDFGLISEISIALIEGKREKILEIISELVEKGTDIKSFTKELVQFFRDLLVASVIKKPEEVLDLSKEEMAVIKDIIGRTSEDQLTMMLSEIMKTEIEVRNALSPRLTLEMSLIKTSFLSTMKPVKEIIENIERYVKDASVILSPKGEESRPSVDSIKDLKGDFFDRALKKMDAPLASKMSKANYELVGDKLVLTLNGGDSLFADSIKKDIGLIEQIFSEELGSKIKIEVEVAKKKSVRKKDLKEKVMEEPIIKEALELFEGRIVDVIPIKDNNQ